MTKDVIYDRVLDEIDGSNQRRLCKALLYENARLKDDIINISICVEQFESGKLSAIKGIAKIQAIVKEK